MKLRPTYFAVDHGLHCSSHLCLCANHVVDCSLEVGQDIDMVGGEWSTLSMPAIRQSILLSFVCITINIFDMKATMPNPLAVTNLQNAQANAVRVVRLFFAT